MKLLLTGYPGFLSTTIKAWFEHEGWMVDTLGILPSPEEQDSLGTHILCDLSKEVPTLPEISYDLVIHAAGKAHSVPKTETEKREFYEVNVTGTENLLKALQPHPPRAIVFISSVAVYGLESRENISEDAPLLATSPYGESKILAEELIIRTPLTAETVRGIVRLPLIAGKNAPGNLGSMITAMRKGFYFNIAGGKTKRSVVLKDDIAPFLFALSKIGGIYNFTDGQGVTYAELYAEIRKIVKCPWRPSLPYWLAWCFALAGSVLECVLHRSMPFDFYRLKKMTQSLTFDSSAAEKYINFTPRVTKKNIQEIL